LNDTRQNRIGHIDSIRGIAAYLVLVHHTVAVFEKPRMTSGAESLLYRIAEQLNLGRAGVVAFFAISGFVICRSLQGTRRAGARKFLVSRFFRLYPPFWTAILLTLIVGYVLPGREIDWVAVAGNGSMLFTLFDIRPLEGLYWTLEVELVFYTLCLALFLCGWIHKPLVLFLCCLTLMAYYQFLFYHPDLTARISNTLATHWAEMPLFLAIMFWGGLFRMWYDDRGGTCALRGYRVPLVVPVFLLLFIILFRPLIYQYVHWGRIWELTQPTPYFIGLGLFTLGALVVRIGNRFFVWLGAISYSIYLLHPVILHAMRIVLKNIHLHWGDLNIFVYLLVCSVLSVLLAGLVYTAVEKPAIRFGRTLVNRQVTRGYGAAG